MISDARRTRKLTQTDLACMLGVKRTTISMWETGKSKPRADMLIKLSDVLGCTVEELLGSERK